MDERQVTFNAAALLLLILCLALIGWLAGRARSTMLAGRSGTRLHSRPQYHGWYVALWLFAPAAIFLAVWTTVSAALITNHRSKERREGQKCVRKCRSRWTQSAYKKNHN